MKRPASLLLTPSWLLVLVLPGCFAPALHVGESAVRKVPASWKTLEVVEGLHGTIEVLERGADRALVIDGAIQTIFPRVNEGLVPDLLLRGGDHVELAPYLHPSARTALVIGLGGGLQARMLELHGLEVTSVDIEPGVVRLAREYFGVTGETVVADGREFLESSSRRFDVIVLDVFGGGEPPAHLMDRGAFEAVRRCLHPGGLVVVHLFGKPDHPAVHAVARRVREIFPELLVTRSPLSADLDAVYLHAGLRPRSIGPWLRARLERPEAGGEAVVELDPATGLPSPVGEEPSASPSLDPGERYRELSRALLERVSISSLND